MRLHEYQSKAQFATYGIPIPSGHIAQTPEQAAEIARDFGEPVVLKAQVLTGGRGRMGAIKHADDPETAYRHAEALLGSTVNGYIVQKLLVDLAIDIRERLYLAITNDRVSGRPVLIASPSGGSDIEDIAEETPGSILWEYINPLIGLRTFQIRRLASNLNLDRTLWPSFHHIVERLHTCYIESDATLVEINPLAITADNSLIAVDGKLLIDDNALFRQQGLAMIHDTSGEHPAETRANAAGLTYIKLDGYIGCMVNGAGLAMTVIDLIERAGGKAANFLDIRGGASAERIATALEIILSDTDVKTVLVNIFGGITHCDAVAQGIINTMQIIRPEIPVVIRLQGTNADLARDILQRSSIPNLITGETLLDAIEKAVHAAREVQ